MIHPKRAAYYAVGHQRDGRANKLEEAYEAVLKARMLAGEIKHYAFESVKLRLADKTFYTPDFLVMNRNNEIELHEVKGFMTDDAAVKLKVAAEMHPFRFFLVTKSGGTFNISEV